MITLEDFDEVIELIKDYDGKCTKEELWAVYKDLHNKGGLHKNAVQ